jgi:hypothetical protein
MHIHMIRLIFRAFVLIGAFVFAVETLSAHQFSLHIADNGRLQIFSARGQKIDDLPQATIGRTIEVPPVVFEVSYGKDISNLLSVIISPNVDRPTALTFMTAGKRIQMDAQAVVTLTFNTEKTKLRVDPGYIGQVTVDGNPIIEETEYAIATSAPTDPGSSPNAETASTAPPSTIEEKPASSQMPAPPLATTTKITPKPKDDEQLPSLDEIREEVPISFLNGAAEDLKDELSEGASTNVATPPQSPTTSKPKPSQPSPTAVNKEPNKQRPDPASKPSTVTRPAATSIPHAASQATKPLAQGFRPNRPLSVNRIDLGNVHLESMLFGPRRGDLPRLASYYKARDKKTPLVYPEDYVQTPSGEFAIADADQYPSRLFLVETFYWMEPVTPPNRAEAPRVAADKMALVEINGDVKVNTVPVRTNRQQEVSSGVTIETGEKSSVAVFLGGVNSIRLSERASMRLQHKIISGFREVIAEIDRGLFFVKVGQRAGEEQRLIFRTPKGIVEAKGTDFAVWVDEQGTYVFLKSGQVNLMSGQAPAKVLIAPEEPAGLSIGSLQRMPQDRLHAMVPIVLDHLKNLNVKTNQILEKASRGLALQKNEKEYLQLIPTVDLITPVHRLGTEPQRVEKQDATPSAKPVSRDRMLRDVKDRMRF